MDWTVVHVITRLELGGAQRATLREAQRSEFAADRGLMFGPGGVLDAEADALVDVAVERVPALQRAVSPIQDLRALVQLYRQLKRKRAGARRLLVHTHSSKAGILGRWAARLAGADLVVHSIHGFGHSHHGSRLARRSFLWAERLTARVTDGFTADSAANIDQGRSEGIITAQPAEVVRCGIDVAAHQNGAGSAGVRAELGIPLDHRVVLNLSVLKPQKDPVAYVELAHRVLQQFGAATFLLAGDGEERARVLARARELGLDERFRLLGWRRDVPALLSASDLLVMTSRWEGLPQAFAQAMAAGLAVVATRVDGAPEAIATGENGYLCEVGDLEAMAGAVVELLRDDARREAMGAAGRARAADFSQEKMVADLDAFYARLALGLGDGA